MVLDGALALEPALAELVDVAVVMGGSPHDHIVRTLARTPQGSELRRSLAHLAASAVPAYASSGALHGHRAARPAKQTPSFFLFASRSVLARTLNATGQSRVTLSLRQAHLRASCGSRLGGKGA